MNYNDLKPCPACGAHPRVQITKGQHWQYVEIECQDDRHTVYVDGESEEQALKKWNDGIIRYSHVLKAVTELVKI